MSAVPVANKLFKSGFSKVSVLKGGMNSWTGAGLPVT
jgi:rhodanese-related sulfurtransferase